MSAARTGPWAALALLLALASRTGAEDAPADTTLGDYLDALGDSTDVFFGMAAARPDTAGLDSALALELARPGRGLRDASGGALSLGPWLGFNRVDGTLWGGSLALGRARGPGVVAGRLGFAAGSNAWLGGIELRKEWGQPRASARWGFRAFGGRLTYLMDPDRSDTWYHSVRALISGADRQSYLRRHGYRVGLARESETSRAVLSWRDEMESRLETTVTWNLLDREPARADNLAATEGRAREIGLSLTTRLASLPAWVEWSSRIGVAGTFTTWRDRFAMAAEIPIGSWAAVVPQAAYGVLSGDFSPQAAFYLGGSQSIRSLPGAALAGRRLALGKLDLVGAPDLLELARIPRPSALLLQGALFAASGATWGDDPYGGPTIPGDEWPEPKNWLSEAGVSLLYRPGLPDSYGFIRADMGWPLGPRAGRERRLAIYYARAVDLLRVPGR